MAGLEQALFFLQDCPSLFADRRFAHLPNFKYLPPKNVPLPDSPKGVALGRYPKFNEPEIKSLSELEQEWAALKQVVEISFSDTSRDNNLICQLFSVSQSGLEKLSIVDFGEFGDDDPFSRGKRVFYVGKLLRDPNGADTFLNIFTVVFD